MVTDNEISWVEDGNLCIDVPKLLERWGYPATEANKDLAIKLIREVAAELYPSMTVLEIATHG